METVEVSGVKLSIDPEVINSYEFFDAACDSQDASLTDAERGFAMHRCIKLTLGNEHGRVIRELTAKKGSAVTVADMADFFNELVGTVKELKK